MAVQHEDVLNDSELAAKRRAAAIAVCVTHLACMAVVGLVLLKSQIDQYGLANGQESLPLVMSLSLMMFGVIPTLPLAAFAAWAIVRLRLEVLGLLATAVASGIHLLIGSLPITLRLGGGLDPVTYEELITSTISCAVIVGIYGLSVLFFASTMTRNGPTATVR